MQIDFALKVSVRNVLTLNFPCRNLVMFASAWISCSLRKHLFINLVNERYGKIKRSIQNHR
jgi:hypothetical protein